VRPSERILVAYYLYTSVLACLLPLRGSVREVTLALNALILVGYGLLIWADSLRRREFLGTVRDWFPLPLLFMAYRQMGWFAPASHRFELERSWIVWDRLLLRQWRLREIIEVLGPVVPSILELCYLVVYATPGFCLAVLYLNRRRDRVDRFLVPFLFGVLLVYGQLVFWPSEPPRTVFPGEDAPTVDTLFRRVNWWLLGGYSIHTGVFPSAHVSAAFAASFAMKRALPERPTVGRYLMVYAVAIALATVYGRYHYAVDAAAGFVVALAVRVWMAIPALSGRRP